MRYLLLLLLASLTLVNGQTPDPESPPPEKVRLTIRVVDGFTGAGVPHATLYIFGAENPDEIVDAPDTDSLGVSRAMLPRGSSFEIVAGAIGYPVAHSVVSVGNDPPTITISVVRAATVFGHVIDADTKEPLAHVPVPVWQLTFVRGLPQVVAAGQSTTTGADGRFESGSLPAGDYIVETYPPPESAIEKQMPEPGYSRQVWPGGRDFGDATPLHVLSGANFDFGTIAIEKRALATVHFRIVGDCPDRRYDVRLVQTYAKGGMDRGAAQLIACGEVSTFPQVPPGSYGLVATDSAGASSGKSADQWIEVTDSDISVDLELRSTPVATIRGRVVSETGDATSGDAAHAIPGVAIRFALGTDVRGLVAGMPLASEDANADVAGSFEQQLYVPPGGKVSVSIDGLPSNLYVDSLRYNGVAIRSDKFVLNELAMAQNLEIICSDKFGAVSGEVVNRDSGPIDVLLVPWPNDGASYPADPLEARGDPSGKFFFSPVRPGRYKALAVRDADRAKFEAPFRLMTALPNALDVDVAIGSGNDIRIKKLED